MIKSPFFQQVNLLLRVLPYVIEDERFALKGGSAINLFWQEMPRLSIDIDLTYLVIEDRETTLNNISNILLKSAEKISKTLPLLKINHRIGKDKKVKKLIINSVDAIIKIEPNETIRGTVFPCEIRDLCLKAQNEFQLFLSARTLSKADLYGSKICAALDRQHPRDIFDIKILLENEGLTEQIRKAFLVYLISHNRPIYELLNPNLLDVENVFNNEFKGMTNLKITYQELCQVRQTIIQRIQTDLTIKEKQFLLCFKEMNPDWSLIGLSGIENLPAVKWKMLNLKKMSNTKHSRYLKLLKQVLNKDTL